MEKTNNDTQYREHLREQLRKNDLGSIDFNIDWSDFGAPANNTKPNFPEIKDYLKSEFSEEKLNDLAICLIEEFNKTELDKTEVLDILEKSSEMGVFGFPKIFEVVPLNPKTIIEDYGNEKKIEKFKQNDIKQIIIRTTTALIEKI